MHLATPKAVNVQMQAGFTSGHQRSVSALLFRLCCTMQALTDQRLAGCQMAMCTELMTAAVGVSSLT